MQPVTQNDASSPAICIFNARSARFKNKCVPLHTINHKRATYMEDLVLTIPTQAIATALTDASVKTGCVDFIGTYSPVTLPGGDQTKLYLGAQNTLYWPSADMPVNACRAYFQLHDLDTSTIRTFNLSFGDGSEDTGIGHTEDDGEYQSSTEITEKAGAWYSLDGRKLNGKPTKKGLYIHGGRKFVVP